MKQYGRDRRMRNTCLVVMMAATLAALTMAGCRSSREMAKEKQHQCSYSYLKGRFGAEVAGVSVNCSLRAECDSVIWVSANKIIELGRMRLTRDSIALYIAPNNGYYRATYDELATQTGYKTSFEEVQQKLGEAYSQQKKSVQVKLGSPKLKNAPTLTLNISRLEATASGQSYPLSIPATAKAININDYIAWLCGK